MSVEYPTLNQLPTARDDAALVYFFKPRDYCCSGLNNYIYEVDDHEILGAVKDGSFFFIHVGPGIYNFSCFELEVEANHTYYLEYGQRLSKVVDNLSDPVDKPITLGALVTQKPYNLQTRPRHRLYLRTPEQALPVIERLTYTVVRMHGDVTDRSGPFCGYLDRPESPPEG